jgi:parallel beta-helix repeat protein
MCVLIVSVTILVLGLVGTASATTWSVDGSGEADFTGIYYENVVVDKSVMLKGIDHPVVDAGGEGRAITLTADGITLVGFTATNSGSLWQDKDAGIKAISSNNNITGNNVCNNRKGIYLYDSCNNTIYFNNFINNTDNIYFYTSTTIWNSPLEMSYTYDGNAYTNYVGNYWGNYGGRDADGDGIGDTHYSIDSEEDESDDNPLMDPFENYILTTSHE